MGLIKAVINSASGVIADQWKEYFASEAMDKDVLVAKGVKKSTSGSQNKGSDNIISNGSVISVADGQCAIIVAQGKVVEYSAEPGYFTYDTSTEPSLFSGNLGKSIADTFKAIGTRIAFGAVTANDQRVYYFNTKEILDNRYGTANPVPFRVVDEKIGLDIDISIRCNGTYSYKITNPLLFYTNVCGNISGIYKRSEIDSTLKSELLTALQPAFAKISAMGVRYSAIPAHTMELSQALNDILSEKWQKLRGLEIVSFNVNSAVASEEDEAMIKQLQKTAVYTNPNMAAAMLTGAQAEAMVAAANNQGQGSFMAFAGMNMAQQAGGATTQGLFNMGQQQQMQQQQMQMQQQQMQQQQMQMQQPTPPPASNGWACGCGTTNTGKFCLECGKPAPAPASSGWACGCGATNTGKFCTECGKPQQTAASYQCDKCGWVPADPTVAPKFCPECGDVFNEQDIK